MVKILILTESFPFPKWDDYLLDELQYWVRSDVEVVIAPASREGEPFSIPRAVTVDEALAGRRHRSLRAAYALRAFGSPLLWRDLARAQRERSLNRRTALASLSTVARTLRSRAGIRDLVRRHGRFDLAYSYWNDTEAIAAVLCKSSAGVRHVVSRAHGFDLYAHRRPSDRMPVKWQVMGGFDLVAVISVQGAEYLRSLPEPHAAEVEVRRLGVVVPNFECRPTGDRELSIVSVAYCVPLKRIDKIVDALAILGRSVPERRISWTHFGDGPLLDDLIVQAAMRLSEFSQIRYEFVGRARREDIIEHYRVHAVDMILSVSDTEGVPVSIMEAMSVGIPAVAPAVGGVPEVVPAEGGRLLPVRPDIERIATTIDQFTSAAKTSTVRRSARGWIETNFNAAINYPAFVDRCLLLVSSGD